MESNNSLRTSIIIILILAIVVLGGTLGYMIRKYKTLETTNTEMQAGLEKQKQELVGQLKEMYGKYDVLQTDNDSMNIKIQLQKEKIENLLKMKADNLATIKAYTKELLTLREVLKSYIVQVDSLNQKNIKLTAENLEVKGMLQQSEMSNNDLMKKNEVLDSIVGEASMLIAKDIIVAALNKRTKDTEKASKTEKLRVCFVIRENKIVKAGTRTVYLRVTRPDDVLLTSPASGTIDFKGSQLMYSEKREVDYLNQDTPMCIYWAKKEELTSGTYRAELYCDKALIGSTTFILR